MSILVCWDVIPCILIGGYEHFRGTKVHTSRRNFTSQKTTVDSRSVCPLTANCMNHPRVNEWINLSIYHSQSTFCSALTPWHQNSTVHHRVTKRPPPVTMLSQLDSLLILPANLPKIHSVPILPSTPRSSELSLSLGLSHQNLVHLSLLSHACHMLRPPHSPCFDLHNDIWGWVKINLS
jgi:hypothetical protein